MEDKPNALEQDSYPKDTEQVQINENYQQEISNQKLYESESSPQFGEAYEVPINPSTQEQYNQIQQVQYQIQNPQIQNTYQISQEELAQYNLINPNIIQNLNNKFEIQQSNVSNNSNIGQVDLTQFLSTRSAAPVNQIQNVAKVEKVEQIQEEDFNKYFTNADTNNIINKEEKAEKEIPFEFKQVEVNANESLPETFGTFNIQQLGLEQYPENQNATTTATETANTVIKKEDNVDVKDLPQNLTEEQIKQIIDMKDLPDTFGSSNINNFKQVITTTMETKGNVDLTNIPEKLTTEQIAQVGLSR